MWYSKPTGVGLTLKLLVISWGLVGASVALAASTGMASEHYLVVDGTQLAQYWRSTKPLVPKLSANLWRQNPSGCAAVSLRIEADGTAHQVQILKSIWTTMMPIYKQMLDTRILNTVHHERFAPGPKNPQRMPVYSYLNVAWLRFSVFSSHPSKVATKQAGQVEKKLQSLCDVPDFVARVARATDTPLHTGKD